MKTVLQYIVLLSIITSSANARAASQRVMMFPFEITSINLGFLPLQNDCDFVYDLTSDNEFLEQLINPVLKNEVEIEEKIGQYKKIYDCINQETEPISDDLKLLRLLTELLLIFAGGLENDTNASTLMLIDLKQSNDPAVIRLRDEAGIPPPEGYIFIRIYSSLEAMPALIKQFFINEEIRGVTIFIRYIAILKESASPIELVLQNLIFPETYSHELVHAYINSSLGIRAMKLPKWYHEGIAIYISESNKDRVVRTPDLTLGITSPEEYKQYKSIFNYLEDTIGRKRLLELIKLSVLETNPSIIYNDLGIANEQVLFARAGAWEQKWFYVRLIFITVLILLFVAWPIRNLIPEVRCPSCDYFGKKKEFRFGFCPKCGNSVRLD